jgi:CDGSH-type Zn-finger protein
VAQFAKKVLTSDSSPTPIRFHPTYLEKRYDMGACVCGHTRDEEKNCDGTHKVVKAVKEDMAEKLAANGFPHASEYVKNN